MPAPRAQSRARHPVEGRGDQCVPVPVGHTAEQAGPCRSPANGGGPWAGPGRAASPEDEGDAASNGLATTERTIAGISPQLESAGVRERGGECGGGEGVTLRWAALHTAFGH